MKYKVIPARRWRNRRSQALASIYGGHPEPGSPDWHIEQYGWTVINTHDGTVGISRVPWMEKADAEAWAREQNLASWMLHLRWHLRKLGQQAEPEFTLEDFQRFRDSCDLGVTAEEGAKAYLASKE